MHVTTAAASGYDRDGRAEGFDMPYTTRGCDMQLFSTSEICDILSKFDQIRIVGDSLMRYLARGFMILLREDLIEEMDGRCRDNFANIKCGDWTICDGEKHALMDPESI